MQNLHKQFVQLGRQKNKIQYSLLQLLPEIYEQGIYKKYCKTIEGYALRFAQIPKSIVQKTLNLEKYLENKPCLKAAIGEVGVHKVAMIASIATPQTDAIFADKVSNMSKDAVQELSKELREKEFGKTVKQFSFLDQEINIKCQAKAKTVRLELDEELSFLFLKVKQKLQKEQKVDSSNREVVRKLCEYFLEEKKDQLKVQKAIKSQKRQALLGESNERSEKRYQEEQNRDSVADRTSHSLNFQTNKISTRYISVQLKRLALQQSNHKCSYPNCNKPPEVFHHPERFAEIRNHHNIKPLCKQHHEFMHNGLIPNEISMTNNWQLKLCKKVSDIDQLYQKYRKFSTSETSE